MVYIKPSVKNQDKKDTSGINEKVNENKTKLEIVVFSIF